MNTSRSEGSNPARPLRIAISATDFNAVGGAERVAVEASNWLARAGHQVTAYGARFEASALDDNVRVREIEVPANLDVYTGLGFRRRAAAAIESDRPDVHGAFSGLSPRGGVFWIPVVSRVGYELLLSRRTLLGGLSVRLNPFHRGRLWMERTMLAPGGYARVLALSNQVKADLIELYEVPEDDIELLAPGYDPEIFNHRRRASRREEARAHFGYSPEDRVLLFVGNELERKGFDTLLRAVGALAQPAVKVLGAGHIAPEADEYRSLIERFDLDQRVRWVGSFSDVAFLHAAADVFVLPTRYEPWGLVIVEALASGLPVVTSQTAGASIAVEDRNTGRLLRDVEDADALVGALRWSLSTSPADSATIAASVDRYTWARVIARYEAVLRSMVMT